MKSPDSAKMNSIGTAEQLHGWPMIYLDDEIIVCVDGTGAIRVYNRKDSENAVRISPRGAKLNISVGKMRY
jgi:hypothetical protein